jgi:hypothetical protein
MIRQRLKITTVRRCRAHTRVLVLRARCPICQREVDTLTPLQTTEVLAVGAEALDGLIARGLVHAIRTVSGSLLLCKDSLLVD